MGVERNYREKERLRVKEAKKVVHEIYSPWTNNHFEQHLTLWLWKCVHIIKISKHNSIDTEHKSILVTLSCHWNVDAWNDYNKEFYYLLLL